MSIIYSHRDGGRLLSAYISVQRGSQDALDLTVRAEALPAEGGSIIAGPKATVRITLDEAHKLAAALLQVIR